MNPNKPSSKLQVAIVPETHWDRAWYMPFDTFRIHLVRLIDNILRTVETQKDFRTFCLDGQTVVIEDYLEIKSNERNRLVKAVQKDRLKVGPWYILPDEFLVSGEAIVRNLLIGREIANGLGKTMPIGYVPDPFGHIGQLPQILCGFGIDNFIFSRGIMTEQWDKGIEFTWTAPDGSKVLALWQKFFYNNAAFLGYHLWWGNSERHIFDPELAQVQLQKAVLDLQKESQARIILLNNGVDHSDVQFELPSIVAEARKRHPDWKIDIAGFDDYVTAIRKDLKSKKLKVHNGELTYPFGDLLIGVYSARMYLKQANAYCQTLLERYAEPLAALARVAGFSEDLRPYLGYAWRQLLRNHPHDDICGCSVDRVHRDMETRFSASAQVGEWIATEGLRRLSHRLDHSGQPGIPYIIFNPAGWKRDGALRIHIDLNIHERAEAKKFRLVNTQGHAIPFVEINRQSAEWMECCKGFHVERVEAVIDGLSLPPCGITSIFAQPGKQAVKPERKVKTSARSMENKYLKVTVRADGTYDVWDKINQVRYSRLGLLEDMEDAGDAYNWSYAKQGKRITSQGTRARIAVIEKTPLSGKIEITTCLTIPKEIDSSRERRSEDTIDLTVETCLELMAGQRYLTVETRVENTARDHRFRVLFPTDLTPEKVHVDGHFDVVERDITPPPVRVVGEYRLQPTMTHCQKTFVDISDGQRGLAVFNDGLPEYEIVPGKQGHTIALTLFRSVGWISRGDFATRIGNAGPSVAAPEAQCLRPFVFRYAVMPHHGNWDQGRVLPTAHAWLAMPSVSRVDLHSGTVFEDVPGNLFPIPEKPYLEPLPREGHLPQEFSFVQIEPETLVLSSCKTAQQGNETIMRFYNPSSRTVKGKITFGLPVKKVRLLNLDETPLRGTAKETMHCQGRAIRMSVPAHRIMTLGLTI